MFLLALVLGKLKGRLTTEDESRQLQALRHLPAAVSSVLLQEERFREWASQFVDKNHCLFLGRGLHYPIALEGALKLKEISYIHAEAYAAGELKHGPLALVDRDMPVVAVAPNDQLLEKLKSNLEEVRARGGRLYVIADQSSGFEAPRASMSLPWVTMQASCHPFCMSCPCSFLPTTWRWREATMWTSPATSPRV